MGAKKVLHLSFWSVYNIFCVLKKDGSCKINISTINYLFLHRFCILRHMGSVRNWQAYEYALSEEMGYNEVES